MLKLITKVNEHNHTTDKQHESHQKLRVKSMLQAGEEFMFHIFNIGTHSDDIKLLQVIVLKNVCGVKWKMFMPLLHFWSPTTPEIKTICLGHVCVAKFCNTGLLWSIYGLYCMCPWRYVMFLGMIKNYLVFAYIWNVLRARFLFCKQY